MYTNIGAQLKDANPDCCNTKTELFRRMKTVFSRLSRETMRAACDRFRSRLEAVVDAEGGYFA